MKRLMWSLGILVLVGSLVGASWALNHATPHSGAKDNEANNAHEPLPEVFCLGVVDVAKGVADLYPKQPGEVAEVADAEVADARKDGKERVFRKGEVLLRLKSEVAEYQLGKAKAAVRAAEDELAKARKLEPERKIKLEMQAAAIRGYQHDRNRVQAELDAKKKAVQEKVGNVSQFVLTAMQEAVAALDEKTTVEEGKKKLLELLEPQREVNRAEADLDAKKLDVKLAEQALKGYRIEAPFDGFILRVHTRVGEILGPSPRVPAIEFCPDAQRIVRAEVIQEWGHRVRVGQEAAIEDDSYMGPQWQGRVRSLSQWYAPKRLRIIEPFMTNDVRTLECVIEFTGGQSPVRIGQRVRVKIKI